MEPEGSLVCLQDLATVLCPEPQESSPHLHTPFPKYPHYYYPPAYA
jgi:hypothetical protein